MSCVLRLSGSVWATYTKYILFEGEILYLIHFYENFQIFPSTNPLKKVLFKSLRKCKRLMKLNFTLKSNLNYIMLCGGGGIIILF